MNKELRFDAEARESLMSGVRKVARAVSLTLGPRGRNVVLEDEVGNIPMVINDGVTIAKKINLANRFEDMGAQLLKQSAEKTNDIAGDGTTTATVLASAMLEEGNKHLVAGVNPMLLRKGMQKACDKAIELLAPLAVPVESKDKIVEVATISCGDADIGQTIADAMEEVGQDGVITIEDGGMAKIHMALIDGMQIPRGFIHPYMITDFRRFECVLENPYILVTDQRITTVKSKGFLDTLEKLARTQVPLFIIAQDVVGEALQTIIMNKQKGVFMCGAIKTPFYGDKQTEALDDICILTGATKISELQGVTFENMTLQDLGRAKKVIIDKDSTLIKEGAGDIALIQKRIELIKGQIDKAQSSYDIEKYNERIGRLTGGMAEIFVGGATESEIQERKLRVEDALSAVRAAVEEGVLPGAGYAYLRIYAEVKALADTIKVVDEKIGANIVLKALQAPIKQIAENSGLSGDVVLNKIMEIIDKHKKKKLDIREGVGLDAYALEYVHLVERGIIDPAKVVKHALINAVSVASVILTTGCIVCIDKEDLESLDLHQRQLM